VAAIFVVLFHCDVLISQRSLGPNLNLYWTSSGVDIFFAISGFVIYLTITNANPSLSGGVNFLARRLIRIVPLYWIATLTKLALIGVFPKLAVHNDVTLWHSVTSLLFLPSPNPNSGEILFPVLAQGWTLSFEMLFYGLATMCLIVMGKPVQWIFIIVAVISLSGLFIQKPSNSFIALINPLMIEFAFGMLIANFAHTLKNLPRRLTVTMIVAATLCFIWGSSFQTERFDIRVLAWGVPGAVIVMAALSFEKIISTRLAYGLNLVGDSSYAIYLFHTFTLPPVAMIFKMFVTKQDYSTSIAITVIGTLASIATGIFIHLAIEKPILKGLRNKLIG